MVVTSSEVYVKVKGKLFKVKNRPVGILLK
jgi:hypothetical protein